MICAIIPARGGSKRIPGKNIKLFAGKPMIAHSIYAARESGAFDRIIVSTDSSEIAQVARDHGAEVPFLRPAALSDDHATTSAVLKHALDELKNQGGLPEIFCCIYATAPLLQPEQLSQGLTLLKSQGCAGAFGVAEYPAPIFRALRRDSKGALEMFWPEHALTRSNDLPQAFFDVGQFYWLKTEPFLKTSRVWAEGALPIIVPRHQAVDIDTPEDWDFAERLYRLSAGAGS